MVVYLYWLISLTIVTYFSAFFVRRFKEVGYAFLVGFYTIYLAASQIFAIRTIKFDLGFHSFYAPAAVFIYPFVAQALDMINEVYGKEKTYLAILIAFLTQVLLVIFIIMINTLKPAPFFLYEEAWRNIFKLGIRITIASWLSFLICQYIDATIFAFLKKKYEKKVLLRSITSDAIDLTLDSIIFVTIAFLGVMPVIPLIIGQIISKNIIGFIDVPFFLWYKKLIKTK
ncbi:MAG: queuosine precursor transporter [candidate division WOR-3 bacterium]|nr:queuosine precursor transporter [candidate division WOR-3 bacterium]MCX7836460.1 queuosine precursor transporter [candidate division WOR-3 bacterium]MDW8114559.1 queuosine precursor transporter [candidate division WOR-3 bacterium]